MAKRSARICLSLAVGALIFTCCKGNPREGRAAVLVHLDASELSQRETACRALVLLLSAALTDPAIRARLWMATHASAHREGKLHLRSYLAGPGHALGRALAARARAHGHELDDLLRRAGNLELYVPVPEHRQAWQGGDELVVATQLDDVRGEIFAAAVAGGRVTLSREHAPSRPVLAVVPSESFRDDGGAAMADLSDGGAASERLAVAGLWADQVRVLDWRRYEGWLWGLPELELHLQDARTRQTIACAESTRSMAPRRLATELGEVTGSALIGTDAELPPGTSFLVALYEDDGTPCATDAVDVEPQIARELRARHGAERAVFRVTGAASVSSYAPTAEQVSATQRRAGDDELVGVATGAVSISSTPALLFLKDEVLASAGSLVLQRRVELVQ